MKRRDFFKNSALAGAALTLNFTGLQITHASNKMDAKAIPDMVSVTGGEPEEMLYKALEALGGINKYIKKGYNVVIKPNIGWDKTPEMAGNTNPDLIKALVKKCLVAGAQKVTVFDHTYDNWQKCYESSGIAAAVKEAGGIIVPANDEKYFKEVTIPDGILLKSAKIHEALLEADAWINVPILKNHRNTKMTCAMKNYMGIVWDKRFFYQNDLQQCIADICTWQKKPVLNIVDAYRIMHHNGPQGKSLSDVATLKTLIASPNIVAIDTEALSLLNQAKKLNIETVAHIERGKANHLGKTDMKTLNIKRIKI